MSMQDFERALQLVRASSESDFVGPRSESLVGRAECVLGLRFPPAYRHFLLELGCGDIAGQEFYGLVGDNFDDGCVPNGIWVTLHQRKYPDTPHEIVVVGSSGHGSFFFVLDAARRTPDGECPVAEWRPGSGVNPANCQVIAEDFGAFFLMLIQEALQSDDESRAE